MKPNNDFKERDNSNFEANDSNILVIGGDRTLPKDSIKSPKSKIFKQIPIEENIEQLDILDSKNSCLKTCINNLDKIDKNISKPLQTYTPNIIIEFIFFIFAKIFNTNTIIIYLFIILIYSYAKNKNFCLFFKPFFHVIVGAIFTALLKVIIGRNRPTLTVKRYFNNVRNKETSKSMPSGDTLQAANFAIMAILYLNCNLKYCVLLLIPGVMCGRIYFNCHYWFDCIIGLILGILLSLGSYFVISKTKFCIV